MRGRVRRRYCCDTEEKGRSRIEEYLTTRSMLKLKCSNMRDAGDGDERDGDHQEGAGEPEEVEGGGDDSKHRQCSREKNLTATRT
jgi:hypothetical protein